MEDGKRKYLFEPVQQQSTSKYGRKVSKLVFKVVQNKSLQSNDLLSSRSNFQNESIVGSEKYPSHTSEPDVDVNSPSIVLCQSDSHLTDSVLEQQLDISPNSVVKKMKINCSCKLTSSLKTKPKLYRKTRGKFKTTRKWEPSELPPLPPLPPLLTQSKTSTSDLETKKTRVQSLQRSDDYKVKGKKGRSFNDEKDKFVEEKIRIEEARLKAENERLSKLLTDLKIKAQEASEIQSYQRERLTLTKLKQNQEILYYYVGFKDIALLDSMVLKLSEYFSFRKKVSEELILEDQLTLTLMKLRRNYSMHDLAFRFRVLLTEADCIVFNIILALHDIYYEQDLKENPFPSVNSTPISLPEQFRSFPNCRVVLECVRVSCEDPDNESEADIFTSTKFDPKITLKGLLGISPSKSVLFASSLYEDSTSNADIFRDSGILEKLEPGDLIMADKSFEISDSIPPAIELNVPAATRSSLTDKQIKNLNSKARTFIGRTTMQHIRRFCILNHVPIFLNSIALQVFQLCSALVNLQSTINSKNEQLH